MLDKAGVKEEKSIAQLEGIGTNVDDIGLEEDIRDDQSSVTEDDSDEDLGLDDEEVEPEFDDLPGGQNLA